MYEACVLKDGDARSQKRGSLGRARTADPVINSHLLYRLSYQGTITVAGLITMLVAAAKHILYLSELFQKIRLPGAYFLRAVRGLASMEGLLLASPAARSES